MKYLLLAIIFVVGFSVGRWTTPTTAPKSERNITFDEVLKYEPTTIWLSGGPKDTRTTDEKVTALQAEVSAIRRHVIASEMSNLKGK